MLRYIGNPGLWKSKLWFPALAFSVHLYTLRLIRAYSFCSFHTPEFPILRHFVILLRLRHHVFVSGGGVEVPGTSTVISPLARRLGNAEPVSVMAILWHGGSTR